MDCQICGEFIKELKISDHVKRHSRNYHPNDPEWALIDEMLGQVKQSLTCSKCQKNFFSKYTLARHQKNSCPYNEKVKHTVSNKVIKTLSEFDIDVNQAEKDREIELIVEAFIKMGYAEQINRIFHQQNQQINTNISGDHTNIECVNIQTLVAGDVNNTVINIIHLHNLGEENLEMIQKEGFVNKIVDDLRSKLIPVSQGSYYLGMKLPPEAVENAIVEIFREMHCNEEYPENHNIYVSDKKMSRNFYVFLNDQWTKTGDREILKMIMTSVVQRFVDMVKIDPTKTQQEKIIHISNYVMETIEHHVHIESTCKKNSSVGIIGRKMLENAYCNKEMIGKTYQKTCLKLVKKDYIKPD